MKMAMGTLISAVSYVFMAIAAGSAGEDGGKCSVWWLILGILALTVGEIYASPVGLSFVTKASPEELVSAMMGLWFLASGMLLNID
jgi:proton-dependent oligopeptide transporter, POT family